MRWIAAVLVAGAALPAIAESIEWQRDRVSLFSRAEELQQPVLILFTSPNCGPRQLPGEISRGGVVNQKDFYTKCERLEQETLSQKAVIEAAERYLKLLAEQSLRVENQELSLENKYIVKTIPTLLVTDPWGNEIVRLVNVTAWEKVASILRALPADFKGLETAGRQLQKDAGDPIALSQAAKFYAERNLAPIAELYYERALGSGALKDDVAYRREVQVARGTNLLRMNRARDAATLFEKAFAEAPDGPQGDALLFGWAMAELNAGREKEAKKVASDLQKRYPASMYSAKAQQNLAAAGAK
jgi:hypothetical protein